MAWDFSTEPDFAEKLEWVRAFVREEVEPLDVVFPGCEYLPLTEERRRIVDPLKQQVRDRGLWAPHLGPDLGGQGFGAVKLTMINEILGGTGWGPIVFGTQAPDTGNAEIIAHYGTQAQKDRYLRPLLDNEIVSAFSMSEPAGGSDPLTFVTRAEPDGEGGWVLNGEKWFSTNAKWSEFLIVMAVTDPDAPPYQRMSMFLVPTKTPGVEIVRNVGVGYAQEGSEGYMRYTDVRLPGEALLGERGGAFVISQTRLGGGRIHHAMRTVGQARKALDLMCQRAVSRQTRDGPLSSKQAVQMQIADSWIELEQFRLLVLHTAWKIDKYKDYRKVRKDIAAVKVAMPRVYHSIATKALHIHGALGVSNEMPFVGQVIGSLVMGIADGPTEVHQVTLARQLLKRVQPSNELFPSYSIPQQREDALEKYAEALAELQEGEAA